jgi:hypothetical protein
MELGLYLSGTYEPASGSIAAIGSAFLLAIAVVIRETNKKPAKYSLSGPF